MRRWLGRQMTRPWVARTACGVSFAAVMLGVTALARALAAGGAASIWAFNAVAIPGLMLFGRWMDRKGY